jgi:hypothetical protein
MHVRTGVRSGTGFIRLLDWRLQWIVVLLAYTNGIMEYLLAKVQAKMDSLIEEMIAEIKASRRKTKAIMKASLEEMKSVADCQEVSNEKVAVETIRELED